MPLDGRQHDWPGRFVEHIRILEHFSTFGHDPFGIGLQHPAANQIVMAIHRSGVVAVQARPEQANVMKYLKYRSLAVAARLGV